MLKWFDNNKYVVLGVLVCGTVILYFSLNYLTERLYYKYPQTITITKYKKVGELSVFGATSILQLPNGQLEFKGSNLSLTDKYNLSINTVEQSKPVIPSNLRLFALWKPFRLDPYPKTFGGQMTVLKPFGAVLSHDFEVGTTYIGVSVEF